VPYKVRLSIDLMHGTYCYDRCQPRQSYGISDTKTHPIKLADIDHGGQVRRLSFDRRSGLLSDYQRFDAGLGMTEWRTSAHCSPAPFRKPQPAEMAPTLIP
jgi:hypothetical protein